MHTLWLLSPGWYGKKVKALIFPFLPAILHANFPSAKSNLLQFKATHSLSAFHRQGTYNQTNLLSLSTGTLLYPHQPLRIRPEEVWTLTDHTHCGQHPQDSISARFKAFPSHLHSPRQSLVCLPTPGSVLLPLTPHCLIVKCVWMFLKVRNWPGHGTIPITKLQAARLTDQPGEAVHCARSNATHELHRASRAGGTDCAHGHKHWQALVGMYEVLEEFSHESN